MPQEQATSAYELLHALDRRCRANAQGLPEQEAVKRTWDGIGFRLGEHKLITQVDDIREILTYPTLSRVPGTKKWVKGVANIRGTLMPILDLQGFLKGDAIIPKRQTRVLVIHQQGVTAGLVVNEVYGLRHFFAEEYTGKTYGSPDILTAYVSGYYRRSDESWGVFDMASLAGSEKFMHVAA